MFTLARINNQPMVRRRAYAYWPFADDFFRPFAEMMNSPMRTGVKETEEAYIFDAELPGFTSEEIELSVQDGVMTIAAEHREGNEDAPAFETRSVRRSFTLDEIDEERISAEYKNGVLRVTLPKLKAPEAPAPRRIEVK